MSDEANGPPTPRVVELSEDVAQRQTWERRGDEGEQEWAAFQAYRDMHPRSLHNCGFVGNVRVASATLSTWYRKFDWERRVNAYDVVLDRIAFAQRKKALERSADDWMAQKLGALETLDKILDLELGKYLESAASGNGVGLIKPADLKGLLETSVKMRRLLKGETTENIGVGDTDISDMPLEEVIAWRERLKAMPKKEPKAGPS